MKGGLVHEKNTTRIANEYRNGNRDFSEAHYVNVYAFFVLMFIY
jgi:hypothetical protein